MINIEHLCKTYTSSDFTHQALTDINLHIAPGDTYGIIGASGAGKSTLVRCINMLERPTSGRIIVDGTDITAVSGKELLDARKNISMIFQNFSLFEQRTVLGNVTFPLELRHVSKADTRRRALELLDLVGLADKAACYPSQLSGGQKQRVAIARALVNQPKIMLCDEATSALDTVTSHAILQLLYNINKELGVTLVVITHSLTVAQQICNNVAVLDAGHVVEQGPTAEVFAHAQSAMLKQLIASEHAVVGEAC